MDHEQGTMAGPITQAIEATQAPPAARSGRSVICSGSKILA
jgi:hypothetical protein